jgi:hypothetical protein
MNIIEADIEIVVGEYVVFEIVCYEDEAETSPYDFTGYDGIAQILDEFGGTSLKSFTVEFNNPADDGIARFRMPKTDSIGLPVGASVWDCLLGASTAQEEVFFRGNVEILAQGSKRS